MRRLLLPFATACLLLFPSCVEWRIGSNIRELATFHSYLELSEAEEGILYVSRQPLPGGAEECDSTSSLAKPPRGHVYYARVPVAEARQSSSTVVAHVPYGDGVQRTTWGRRPTGMTRLVARTRGKLYLLPEDAELPADAEVRHMKLCEDGDSCFISTRRSGWYVPAAILAAPFDYVIDPALVGVSTVGLWVAALASGAVQYPVYAVERAFGQNASETTTQTDSPIGEQP